MPYILFTKEKLYHFNSKSINLMSINPYISMLFPRSNEISCRLQYQSVAKIFF